MEKVVGFSYSPFYSWGKVVAEGILLDVNLCQLRGWSDTSKMLSMLFYVSIHWVLCSIPNCALEHVQRHFQ